MVSFFALSRLGFTVLSLSLRITSTAIVNLLQKTECQTIVHGHQPQVGETLREIKQDYHIYTLCVPSRSDYDRPPSDEPYFIRDYDRKSENEQVALIIHSSGSTGLPKPVFLSHKALLTHPTQGSGLHNFNALPWYHLYGISTSLQAMWMRKTAYLYNTSVPLTADNLVAVVEKVKPEAVHVVPYVLGLLAEKQRGVDVLKGCKTVTAAGARTPDELGDRLVREGINLGVVFGTSVTTAPVSDCNQQGLEADSFSFSLTGQRLGLPAIRCVGRRATTRGTISVSTPISGNTCTCARREETTPTSSCI